MTIPSLSDMVQTTKNTVSQSTEGASEEEDGDETQIPEVFSEIGADLERVQEFWDERDTDDHERITELAEYLIDNEEAWVLLEGFRLSVDMHRIMLNYVRGQREGEFIQQFSQQLYGPSDGSVEGTKNWYEDQIRDDSNPLNLALYKVMFPEPVEEHHEVGLVCFSEGLDKFDEIGLPGEDGVQDSHIYVTETYIEEFSQFPNDEGLPLPPADFPEGTSESGSGAPEIPDGEFDPADYTIDELEGALEDIDDIEILAEVLTRERHGKERVGAKDAIRSRMSEV